MASLMVDGEKLVCPICKSDDLEIVCRGKVPTFTNLRCPEGHLKTIRDEVKPFDPTAPSKPAPIERDKVKIIRHDITIEITKMVTLFLPEPENPMDYIHRVNLKNYDGSSDIVMKEKYDTGKTMFENQVYNDKGKIDFDKWDIERGKAVVE